MPRPKHAECYTCFRSTVDGVNNPDGSYCEVCLKEDGKAFPSFYIKYTPASIEEQKIPETIKEVPGLSASYYRLPPFSSELQDLISFLNCNAQLGEIGRAWYRYSRCPHSDRIRDLNKIIFYAKAEIARITKYEGEVK